MGNSGNITSIFSFCYSIDNLCAKAYIISIAKHTFFISLHTTNETFLYRSQFYFRKYIYTAPTNTKRKKTYPSHQSYLLFYSRQTHINTHIYIYTYLNIKIAFNWLHLFLKAFFVQKSKTIKIFDGQEKTKKRVKNFFNSFFKQIDLTPLPQSYQFRCFFPNVFNVFLLIMFF